MLNKFGGFIILFFLLMVFPQHVLSKIGVGVGTGKIDIEEKLKPGSIYNLPELTIINTGDEAGDYVVGVQYREYQVEEKPPADWFKFSPSEFYLEPGESQIVQTELNIPIKGVKPVKYFVFLSGSPTKRSEDGSTTIGVAAAAKLYFEVEPGNIFEGIFYRVLSIYKNALPWSNIVLETALFLTMAGLIRKYLNIDVGIKRGKKLNKDEE